MKYGEGVANWGVWVKLGLGGQCVVTRSRCVL